MSRRKLEAVPAPVEVESTVDRGNGWRVVYGLPGPETAARALAQRVGVTWDGCHRLEAVGDRFEVWSRAEPLPVAAPPLTPAPRAPRRRAATNDGQPGLFG